MNLFNGLGTHQIESLAIAAVIFTAASGVSLVALIAFGVRAGLMAARATAGVPAARDLELGMYLAAALLGLLADFVMVFFGLAENYLDNPIIFVLAAGPTLLGGLLFLGGAGQGMRTVRRARMAARAERSVAS